MLVTMKDMLRKARQNHYGVVAATMFDEDNIRVAIEAAQEEQAPIILNFNLGTKYLLDDFDAEVTIDMARKRAQVAKIPIAINADHCRDMNAVMKAIHLGFSSVMFDGSYLSFEENITKTKNICQMAHACGMSVEAELGCVGIGNPDDPNILRSMGAKETQSYYTDPLQVSTFVKETGIDCLAISIGNAHGPYAKGIHPHIAFDRLEMIAQATEIPLVLHGGSGTGEDNLSKACKMGISKINVATDLMLAQIQGFEESKTQSFSRFRFEEALNSYKEEVRKYIRLFGSSEKA